MIFELPWYFDGSWEIVIWSQLCNQNFLWIWDSGRKKRWEMVGRNGNPHSSESRRQWPRRRKAPPWHRSVWVKRCEKMWKVSFKASLCFAIVSPATLSLKIDGSTVLLCYFAILSSCNRVSGCQQCIESWSNGSDWNHSFLKLVTVLNAAPNFIKGLAMPQAECRRNKKQEMFLARTCPLTVIHSRQSGDTVGWCAPSSPWGPFCETDPDSAENLTKPQKTELCDVSMFPSMSNGISSSTSSKSSPGNTIIKCFDSTWSDVKCSDLRCGSRWLSANHSDRTLASLQAEVLNAYEAAIVWS